MSLPSQPPSQVPQAPDSPVVVVSGNVQKYAMKKKKILNAEESELFELTQAAGITLDQEVFKIIVDLLKMNVAPQAVFQTLKAMCAGQRIVDTCGADTSTTHPAGATAATTEHREEDTPLVPSKTSKPPAGTSSASGPRATRLGTKIVVYGPQDNSSSQGPTSVRSKAGHGEKTRESSSQRVQRPPSATRGQKTKSSGSSSSSSQMASN
ncbi:Mitotic-spindle organizing protein 2 [Merluccius polli]|uniref:Mitotic-spindle organizing protein 2 n=1 Tax=Merluccius polli TaxID=89951 RepID=A0AA47M5B7_MERPO|nr:Mitotic-spindle organizing protein 2 [Merluccius polli]